MNFITILIILIGLIASSTHSNPTTSEPLTRVDSPGHPSTSGHVTALSRKKETKELIKENTALFPDLPTVSNNIDILDKLYRINDFEITLMDLKSLDVSLSPVELASIQNQEPDFQSGVLTKNLIDSYGNIMMKANWKVGYLPIKDRSKINLKELFAKFNNVLAPFYQAEYKHWVLVQFEILNHRKESCFVTIYDSLYTNHYGESAGLKKFITNVANLIGKKIHGEIKYEATKKQDFLKGNCFSGLFICWYMEQIVDEKMSVLDQYFDNQEYRKHMYNQIQYYADGVQIIKKSTKKKSQSKVPHYFVPKGHYDHSMN